MRKIGVTLLLGLTLSAQASNEDLKNSRDGVKAAYPVWVDATYQNYVAQYYSIRQYDLASYLSFLSQEAAADLERIRKAHAEFESLRSKSLEEQGPRKHSTLSPGH